MNNEYRPRNICVRVRTHLSIIATVVNRANERDSSTDCFKCTVQCACTPPKDKREMEKEGIISISLIDELNVSSTERSRDGDDTNANKVMMIIILIITKTTREKKPQT